MQLIEHLVVILRLGVEEGGMLRAVGESLSRRYLKDG